MSETPVEAGGLMIYGRITYDGEILVDAGEGRSLWVTKEGAEEIIARLQEVFELAPVTVKVCWGHFGQRGEWHHNRGSAMSPDEQKRQNVENGYMDERGFRL